MARILRHPKTGTVCPGLYCEECTVEWFLTGELYLLVEDDADPVLTGRD